MKIGYLGPRGSFSEEAAILLFPGRKHRLVQYSSFGLVGAFEGGEVGKIVVPIENSIEGLVTWLSDFLLESSSQFCIEKEFVLPIVQNLIGFGALKDIETVCSIPQALGQCRKFLSRLGVKTQDTDSTSAAVNLVAQKRNPRLAAIGSKRASMLSGVPLIEENIGDRKNNQTRFIVLGEEQEGVTGRDKTSIVFGFNPEEANRSGTLHRVTTIFSALDISMTMIHSRPSKDDGLGNYVFFVDVEGHKEDTDLQVTLERIQRRTSFLKVLGSYPRAD